MVFSDVFRLKPVLAADAVLPLPGTMLSVSTAAEVPFLTGLRLDPDDPFKFEFIVDTAGRPRYDQEDIMRQVRYFFAGLTTPKQDIWVNLSPYEHDRILDTSLDATEIGRDLLQQDYILKQLSASLTHPDTPSGRAYWDAITDRKDKDVITQSRNHLITNSDLSRIWIVPDRASVHEHAGGRAAFITEALLKVETVNDIAGTDDSLLPRAGIAPSLISGITQEVNSGSNFARLRQIYNALILAQWFKDKFSGSLYSEYIDKKKLQGIQDDKNNLKEKIFDMYVESFKRGAYDVIRKYDGKKRRFFSGGSTFEGLTVGSYKDIPDVTGRSLSSAVVNVKSGTSGRNRGNIGMDKLRMYLADVDSRRHEDLSVYWDSPGQDGYSGRMSALIAAARSEDAELARAAMELFFKVAAQLFQRQGGRDILRNLNEERACAMLYDFIVRNVKKQDGPWSEFIFDKSNAHCLAALMNNKKLYEFFVGLNNRFDFVEYFIDDRRLDEFCEGLSDETVVSVWKASDKIAFQAVLDELRQKFDLDNFVLPMAFTVGMLKEVQVKNAYFIDEARGLKAGEFIELLTARLEETPPDSYTRMAVTYRLELLRNMNRTSGSRVAEALRAVPGAAVSSSLEIVVYPGEAVYLDDVFLAQNRNVKFVSPTGSSRELGRMWGIADLKLPSGVVSMGILREIKDRVGFWQNNYRGTEAEVEDMIGAIEAGRKRINARIQRLNAGILEQWYDDLAWIVPENGEDPGVYFSDYLLIYIDHASGGDERDPDKVSAIQRTLFSEIETKEDLNQIRHLRMTLKNVNERLRRLKNIDQGLLDGSEQARAMVKDAATVFAASSSSVYGGVDMSGVKVNGSAGGDFFTVDHLPFDGFFENMVPEFAGSSEITDPFADNRAR